MEAKDLISALLASGMTQAQIAERIGTRQATVSKVLRGKAKDVMSVTYRRLQALHDERSAEAAHAAAARQPAEHPAARALGRDGPSNHRER